MMGATRRGMATVLVLSLMLVLGVFGGAMMLMSRGANREVDVLGDHLRALAVGDAAFTAVMGRLSSKPWSQRWFIGGPDVRRAVPAAGGTYDVIVRDAPRPASPPPASPAAMTRSPNQADLLVRATHGRSTVVLYWRLICPDDALDAFARVVPTFFGYQPEDTVVRPASLDPIAAAVEEQLTIRENNGPRFEDQRGQLSGPVNIAQVGTIVGAGAVPNAVDAVTFPGEPPRPNETYLGTALASSGPGAPPLSLPVPSNLPLPTLPPVPTIAPPAQLPPGTPPIATTAGGIPANTTPPPTPTWTTASLTGLPPGVVMRANNYYSALSRYACAVEAAGGAGTPSHQMFVQAAENIRATRAAFGLAVNTNAPQEERQAALDAHEAALNQGQYAIAQGGIYYGGGVTGTSCDNQRFDL